MENLIKNCLIVSGLVFVILSSNAETKEGPETTIASQTSDFTSLTPPEEPYEITTPANVENEVTEASPNLRGSLQEKSALDSKSITERYQRPYTVLEYVPITSFYHPRPVTLAQLIPPGTPWPTSADGYTTTRKPAATTSRVKTTRIPPSIVDRFPELTTVANKDGWASSNHHADNEISKATTVNSVSTHIVLEYVPSRPPYVPNPVTIPQLIPPGEPWPDSPEGYQTSSSQRPTINLDDRVDLPAKTTRFPELTTVANKEGWASSNHHADNEISKATTANSVSSHIVLEYVPSRPPYVPNPVTIPQLIPPGEPWPDSPEGYQTSSPQRPTINLDDRVELPTKTTIDDYVSPQTVLEYKPSTSFHHPNPVTVAQIIPSGQPLPASPTKSTLPPNLVDRFPELTSQLSTKRTTPTATNPTTTTAKVSSTHVVLEYKPQRPWFHPQPGNTLGQIIPPGKPWPSSPDGYNSFSVTKRPPWLRKYIDSENEEREDLLPYSKPDDQQPAKQELNLPEPNALQYYEPIQRSTSAPPFTSGPQKTTISDIIDILKEVHNITLTTNKTAPEPSHLLPFDADKEFLEGPLMKSPISNPRPQTSGYEYSNVVNTQGQQKPNVASNTHVYDGVMPYRTVENRERVFPNPKYVHG